MEETKIVVLTDEKDFDFKKAQRELIRKELRPILYENGFVLSRPTTYIRERDGLLQEFYFRVEVSKLRPWVSYRPVFDSRPIVSFGTDGIYVHDCLNPYKGFAWCSLEDWYIEDNKRRYSNFQNKFLPDFERLRSSIVNGVLPEMNELHSLDDFIKLYETNGLLFQKQIKSYDTSDRYGDFISNVSLSSGKERMNIIMEEMEKWDLQNLPKIVREYLESYKECSYTDDEADKIFYEYCNKIRIANKLRSK